MIVWDLRFSLLRENREVFWKDVSVCVTYNYADHNVLTAKIHCIGNSYTIYVHKTIRFMMTDGCDGHQGLILIALLK